MDVRVVNATTGEVDFSRTVEGRTSGGGVSVGVFRGGFGGSLSQEKNTPAGKAIRAVLVEVTDYLSCVMVEQNGCEADYDAKERKRRDSNKKVQTRLTDRVSVSRTAERNSAVFFIGFPEPGPRDYFAISR